VTQLRVGRDIRLAVGFHITKVLGFPTLSDSEGGESRRYSRNLTENDLRLLAWRMCLSYYADGHRSILEIRDAFTAEYTPVSVETTELCFRAFEKAGVMAAREK